MECPGDLKYTKDHEWVRYEDGIATFGITDFAQEELGDIVFVELPEVGTELSKGESYAVVESTKAASDIYAPISGTIKEVNEALSNDPELINSSSFVEGWLIKLEKANEDELEELMDAEQYTELIEA